MPFSRPHGADHIGGPHHLEVVLEIGKRFRPNLPIDVLRRGSKPADIEQHGSLYRPQPVAQTEILSWDPWTTYTPRSGHEQVLEQRHGIPVGHAGQEVPGRRVQPLGFNGHLVEELLGPFAELFPKPPSRLDAFSNSAAAWGSRTAVNRKSRMSSVA